MRNSSLAKFFIIPTNLHPENMVFSNGEALERVWRYF